MALPKNFKKIEINREVMDALFNSLDKIDKHLDYLNISMDSLKQKQKDLEDRIDAILICKSDETCYNIEP